MGQESVVFPLGLRDPHRRATSNRLPAVTPPTRECRILRVLSHPRSSSITKRNMKLNFSVSKNAKIEKKLRRGNGSRNRKSSKMRRVESLRNVEQLLLPMRSHGGNT